MSKNNIVESIVEYIENHLNEELSMDSIAKELNYSKYYIARTFAEKTGCIFVHRKPIERTAYFIRNRTGSV